MALSFAHGRRSFSQYGFNTLSKVIGLTGVLVTAILLIFAVPSTSTLVSVTTYHNNNARDGLNAKETMLRVSNVNAKQFGKLFSHSLDGYVYAQPLYLPQVNVGGTMHNVLYVATEHDTVFAFDADNSLGANHAPLWKRSFINPSLGITTVASRSDLDCTDLVPEVGITGTPVIDPTTNTMYFVVRTRENGAFFQRLHALDVSSGAEKFRGPIDIQARVRGHGDGSIGGFVYFDPLRNNQRPGLLLQNGSVYISWASHCDHGPYHGWLISYNATTLQQNGVWNASPNAGLGGIWQAGGAPASDDAGNIYLATGNARFDANRGGRDFGDSVVKLGAVGNSLQVTDYFTPFDQGFLNDNDVDLGSGGPILLPTQPPGSPHQHLLTVGGKEGVIYVIDADNLGQFNDGSNAQIVQSIQAFSCCTGGNAAWWNNHVYFPAVFDPLKAFSFDPSSGLLSESPTSQTDEVFSFPGTMVSVSANGNRDGIVWVIQDDAYPSGPAVLRAYDAADLAHELYDSNQNVTRDSPGRSGKFTVPTIANGKVYVATRQYLSVYGLF
jgi:hypothetical protein